MQIGTRHIYHPYFGPHAEPHAQALLLHARLNIGSSKAFKELS